MSEWRELSDADMGRLLVFFMGMGFLAGCIVTSVAAWIIARWM